RVGLFDKPDDLLGAESALLHVRPLGFTDFIASAGTAQWGQVMISTLLEGVSGFATQQVSLNAIVISHSCRPSSIAHQSALSSSGSSVQITSKNSKFRFASDESGIDGVGQYR
ncbi:hypothetical protein P2B11_14565, partial [Xanthomonas perforans]